MGRAVAGGSGARGAGTAAGPMAHFDHPPLAHGGARSEGVVARYSGSAQTVASRRAPPRRFRPVATAVRSADYVCDTPPTACAISAWVRTRARPRRNAAPLHWEDADGRYRDPCSVRPESLDLGGPAWPTDGAHHGGTS